jgi:hypothetical protein
MICFSFYEVFRDLSLLDKRAKPFCDLQKGFNLNSPVPNSLLPMAMDYSGDKAVIVISNKEILASDYVDEMTQSVELTLRLDKEVFDIERKFRKLMKSGEKTYFHERHCSIKADKLGDFMNELLTMACEAETSDLVAKSLFPNDEGFSVIKTYFKHPYGSKEEIETFKNGIVGLPVYRGDYYKIAAEKLGVVVGMKMEGELIIASVSLPKGLWEPGIVVSGHADNPTLTIRPFS